MITDGSAAPPGPTGAIGLQDEDGERVLHLLGDVDTEVVAAFEAEHGRDIGRVDALDAAAVTFISSAGAAFLLRTLRASTAAGHPRPLLRRSSPALERVLALPALEQAVRRGPDASRPVDG